MEQHIFTENEALNACMSIINEYEETLELSDIRIQFAEKMLDTLGLTDRKIISSYYPFRNLIPWWERV